MPRGSTKFVWGILFFKASAVCWHADGGRGGEGSRGGRRRSPGGVQGRSPGGGFGGAPDCHETNLKCLMNKLCHEMKQLDEQSVHLLVAP